MTTFPIEVLKTPLGTEALDILFRTARTYNAWLDEPVAHSLLREVYNLARMGPTSANLAPARFVFLTTTEAKGRLLPALAPQNVEKSRTAPVVALIAYDTAFYEYASKLFPHSDVRAYFAGNDALIQETALRNSSLQGAYFMLAARALGLDCGPMSGFDEEKVNAEFFSGGTWKINFVCNLGYGSPVRLYPRLPRLEFDETCVIL
jgi:3-hydroxypropanoate dehydrogenase